MLFVAELNVNQQSSVNIEHCTDMSNLNFSLLRLQEILIRIVGVVKTTTNYPAK